MLAPGFIRGASRVPPHPVINRVRWVRGRFVGLAGGRGPLPALPGQRRRPRFAIPREPT